MKKLIVAVLASLVAGCAPADEQTIAVGSTILGVDVEGEDLSDEATTLIAEDVQRVLSATCGAVKCERCEDREAENEDAGGRLVVVGPHGHNWAEPYWKNDFGDCRFPEAAKYPRVVVPKELVKAYVPAIEFKRNHSEAFRAFSPCTFLVVVTAPHKVG